MDVNKLTKLGLLAGIGVVLMALIRIPVLGFLEYDPADIPILIGTLLYGPVSGLALTLVVSGIQAIMFSASSGIIGFYMHVMATGSMVVVTGLIYHRGSKSMSATLGAMIAGSVAMVAVAILNNLLITPFFMEVPLETVKSLILPVFLPFNAIKAVVNSAISFFMVKALEKTDFFRS